MRKFTSHRAVRANVPLLIALIGPSTSGKTYSAHRLAKGIARVQPGPVFGIDTENRGTRMLELADKFDFQHVPFEPPFGSLDYLAALSHCAAQGARTVIVDSMSHEHEGEGGMLDAAERDVNERITRRLQKEPNAQRWKLEQSYKMSGFIKPKADRAKLIQGMLQLNINVILCFRAKEKVKPVAGGEPLNLGWQAIAGDEFWYEMTTRCLLLPGANGIPSWDLGGREVGEKAVIRRPEQFRTILRDGAQLSEEMGEAMARWASGSTVALVPAPAQSNTAPGDAAEAMRKINGCLSLEQLKVVAAQQGALEWSEAQRKAIKATVDARAAALKKGD